jgi:hypothetical protein
MKRFKSAGQAQRFLSAHDQINNLFPLCREPVTATDYRAARTSTTLPPSRWSVMDEAMMAGWATDLEPGQRGNQASPDLGQARLWRWSWLGGSVLAAFFP